MSETAAARRSPLLRVPLTLRFGDCDPAGILYYPRFLHFCHVAMEETFARIVGVPYPAFIAQHDLGLPTVRTEVDYRRSIRYGEPLELEVTVTRIGDTSVVWHDRFLVGGVASPAAEARIVTVLVRMSSWERVAVPDWLRARLLPPA